MGTMGMWRSHGDKMWMMWGEHGVHRDVETMWGQHGDSMGTTGMWRPHGDNIETTWGQHENNVDNSILFEDF